MRIHKLDERTKGQEVSPTNGIETSGWNALTKGPLEQQKKKGQVTMKAIILRGLPESGKTEFYRKEFSYSFRSGCYFSTDDYWMSGGVYKFDPTRLGEAHSWNFRRFLDKFHYTSLSPPRDHERETIVVDNTNITAIELAPYVQACNAHGVDYEIVTIWCDPIVAFKRNKHEVPLDVVLKMYSNLLKEELPPFWKKRTIILPDKFPN